MYTSADSFTQEYGFFLYPTREVKQEANRLRRNKSPRSPSNLVNERKIISGEIEKVFLKEYDGEEIRNQPNPSIGDTLVVQFEDSDGGTSRVELMYEKSRKGTGFARSSIQQHYKGWDSPILYPSKKLQNNQNYEWNNPQQIHELEFI